MISSANHPGPPKGFGMQSWTVDDAKGPTHAEKRISPECQLPALEETCKAWGIVTHTYPPWG